MKTLIKNAWILTMDQALSTYPQGMLMMEDDQITYVGDYDALLAEDADEVIDAMGGLLIPGMVNTHAHVSMIPFRSLGDDCPDRLRRYLFPLEIECMNASLVYEAARYGILEMQRSGVTTFLDMYYFEEEVHVHAMRCKCAEFLERRLLTFQHVIVKKHMVALTIVRILFVTGNHMN